MKKWQVFIKNLVLDEEFRPANIGSIVFPGDWILEHDDPSSLNDKQLNKKLNCKSIKWSKEKDYLIGIDKDDFIFKLQLMQ